MAEPMDEVDYELLVLQAGELRRKRVLDLVTAGSCDRCGASQVVEFADEICTACPHVPLCVPCSYAHADEAREDGTVTPWTMWPRG